MQDVRSQFPSITGSDLVYLDSAATTQKPQVVLDTLQQYYASQNANVHRGSHSLTAKATSAFEDARETVRSFINAASSKEIIWTRGATEAVNLVAQTWARSTLKPGDEILVGEMEHHANIVPWQMVAGQTGAKVVKIPMTPAGELDMDAFEAQLSDKTALVAVAHITNVTGYRQPIETIIEKAHAKGAVVVVDGAQGIVHEKVDVQALDADFYLFSGHKLYAPTGIGALYGKQSLLEQMPPWHGGGKMVEKVTFEQTTFSGLPGKFEAGTPNIAGAIAMTAAIKWYNGFDRSEVEAHLHKLQQTAAQKLQALDDDLRLLGYQPDASVLTFVIDGIHHQDIATLLDQQNIAVRAGHHCAHPLMDAFGVSGTVRVSFGIYNTMEDVEKLVAGVEKALELL